MKRACLVVAFLACLVYVPSLGGGFVYDDVAIVAAEKRVQEGDLRGALVEPYWRDRMGGLYRPVTTVSLVAQGFVSKTPFGFRLVNIALHAAATVLALVLARRITGSDRAAFLAAALFAVHPIHVEVAGNIVGRSESLAFLLGGGAWLLAVPAAAERDGKRLAFAALLATLGALAKENALAVALAAPLEVFLLGRGARRTRSVVLAALPAVVGAALALAARRAALGSDLTPASLGITSFMNPLANAPLGARVANIPLLLLTYAKNLVLPIALAPDYGGAFLPLAKGLDGHAALLGLGAAALLLAPGLVSGRRGLFASAFFVLALLPVLQLVPIGTLVADRVAYAASFGFALAVAMSLDRAPRWLPAVALGLLAAITLTDARAWMDTVRLLRRAESRAPGSVQIPYVLGQILASRAEGNDLVEAADLLARAAENAARSAPEEPRPLLHLGFAEHKLHRLVQAREHLERGLERHPNEEGKARAELGSVLLELGETRRAEEELARASDLIEDARVLAMLGSLRAKHGDTRGARAALEKSLRLDPAQEKAEAVRKLLDSLPKD